MIGTVDIAIVGAIGAWYPLAQLINAAFRLGKESRLPMGILKVIGIEAIAYGADGPFVGIPGCGKGAIGIV